MNNKLNKFELEALEARVLLSADGAAGDGGGADSNRDPLYEREVSSSYSLEYRTETGLTYLFAGLGEDSGNNQLFAGLEEIKPLSVVVAS